MNKKIVSIISSTALLAMPLMALAGVDFTTPSTQNISLQALILKILDITWWIFVGIAVIMFIVAGVSFLTARGEPEAVGKARQFVIYGAVGIVVAVLAFSITLILRNTFGI
ncbi:MAG: hypothetical protein AAB877_03715 [Patescibacteria group bacterium]